MFDRKTFPVRYFCLAITFTMSTGYAGATTTVCSEQQSRAHHYGQKAAVKFNLPSVAPDKYHSTGGGLCREGGTLLQFSRRL